MLNIKKEELTTVGVRYIVTYRRHTTLMELAIGEVSPSKNYVRYSVDREGLQGWTGTSTLIEDYDFIEKL